MKRRRIFIAATALGAFSLACATLWPKSKSSKAGGESIGQQFHDQTMLSWKSVMEKVVTKLFSESLPRYKEYPDSEKLSLPKPDFRGLVLEEAILKRRSRRVYGDEPVSLEQLAQLLFAAGGISKGELRTAPSAGGKMPFEIYVIVNNVRSLRQGIYHYSVRIHELELIKTGNFKATITKAGMEQGMLGSSGVTIVISAIFGRMTAKYGNRGYRYTYMEAGHISQNLYLQAESLGLGSVCVGAFLDDEINSLIGIDGKSEAVISLQAVGTL